MVMLPFFSPFLCDGVIILAVVVIMHSLVPLCHFLCVGSWSGRVGVMKFEAQSLKLLPSSEQNYEP